MGTEESKPTGPDLALGIPVDNLPDGHMLAIRLEAARTTFEECLAISRQLAEQDPSNAGSQQDLGGALNRFGGLLQAQGKLEAARATFEEALAINRRLVDQDPSNANWRQDLAAALARFG
jgi:tetratricopeptide (TPR) repeat protein